MYIPVKSQLSTRFYGQGGDFVGSIAALNRDAAQNIVLDIIRPGGIPSDGAATHFKIADSQVFRLLKVAVDGLFPAENSLYKNLSNTIFC